MMLQAPHILIIGLGSDCAQSALIHLHHRFPDAVFTGWSRSPETLPEPIRSLCVELHPVNLDLPQSKEKFTPFDLILFIPPAKYLPKILKSSNCPLIALGSTRKFTAWPDSDAFDVLSAEKLLYADRRPSFLLHPTMIYGNKGNQNLSKLGKIIKYCLFIPLPEGGRHLVQPIHYDDVGKALAQAAALLLLKKQQTFCSIILAGPESFSYRELIDFLIQAQNLSKRFILSIPLPLLMFFNLFLQKTIFFLPGVKKLLPTTSALRRLTEDKNFSITLMKKRFGFSPRTLTPENWQKKTLPETTEISNSKKTGVNDGT